jgi:hypothetical protein
MTDYEPTVYLAGPVQHADDGGHGWRDDIEAQYGDQFDFLNPLDKYDTPSTEVAWLQPDEVPEDYDDGMEVLEPRDIVGSDKEMIDASDAILIGLQDHVPMYGTPREHEYAHQTDTEVVVWHAEGLELSPWTISDADFLSHNLDECMDHIYFSNFSDAVRHDVVDTILENL